MRSGLDVEGLGSAEPERERLAVVDDEGELGRIDEDLVLAAVELADAQRRLGLRLVALGLAGAEGQVAELALVEGDRAARRSVGEDAVHAAIGGGLLHLVAVDRLGGLLELDDPGVAVGDEPVLQGELALGQGDVGGVGLLDRVVGVALVVVLQGDRVGEPVAEDLGAGQVAALALVVGLGVLRARTGRREHEAAEEHRQETGSRDCSARWGREHGSLPSIGSGGHSWATSAVRRPPASPHRQPEHGPSRGG